MLYFIHSIRKKMIPSFYLHSFEFKHSSFHKWPNGKNCDFKFKLKEAKKAERTQFCLMTEDMEVQIYHRRGSVE